MQTRFPSPLPGNLWISAPTPQTSSGRRCHPSSLAIYRHLGLLASVPSMTKHESRRGKKGAMGWKKVLTYASCTTREQENRREETRRRCYIAILFQSIIQSQTRRISAWWITTARLLREHSGCFRKAEMYNPDYPLW